MKTPGMKISLLLFVAVCWFFFTVLPAGATVKDFIRDYTYQASEADSKQSCRVMALEQVKRLLLEELGTYLESHTEVKGFQLSKDEITTLTGGVVQTRIMQEKWDGEKYWLQAKIEADPDDVAKKIDSLREDRDRSEELMDLKRKLDELIKENNRLRQEGIGKSDKEKVARYQENIKALDVNELLQKGAALRNQGKLHESIEVFNTAIKESPKMARPYVGRGISYVVLKETEKALADYNTAIALEAGGEPTRAHFFRGNLHLLAGRYGEAIADFNWVIAMNPKPAAAYNKRGLSYSRSGEKGKALEDYNRALSINPRYPEAFNNRGAYYLSVKRYREALEDFNRALSIHPKYAMAQSNRGVAYAALGEDEKAFADYKQAITLDPKYAPTFRHRGNLYLKNNEYLQAVEDLTRAVTLSSEDALAYFSRAAAYTKLGSIEKAVADYTEAIALNPKDGRYYFNRALLYGKLKKGDLASEDMKKAAQLGHSGAQELFKKKKKN